MFTDSNICYAFWHLCALTLPTWNSKNSTIIVASAVRIACSVSIVRWNYFAVANTDFSPWAVRAATDFLSISCCMAQAFTFTAPPRARNLRRIAHCDRASFCIVGHTAPQPGQFTTEYESVLVFGRIAVVADDTERMQALKYLIGKYSADFEVTGLKYAEKSFHRTAILRLDIERISGKCKKMK